MYKNISFDYPLFLEKTNEVGSKVQKYFIKTLYENLENVELIVIYNFLKSYWFDSFRSSIIWFSNKIVGGIPEKTVKLSLVMSLAGSGLGIHDDIIDKTSLKGQRKTIQELFGLELALVAGDLLIIKGLMSSLLWYDEYDRKTRNLLVNVLNDYFIEMAIAEVLEIRSNKRIDMDVEKQMNLLRKLGVDVETCAKLGAISGGGNNEEINALTYFGSAVGYINRMNEEINDVINNKNRLKERIRYESIPFALLYAAQKSEVNYKIINGIISNNIINDLQYNKLLKIINESMAIEFIKKEIVKIYYEAKKGLDIFPESDSKKMLTWCLYYIKNKNDIILGTK